MQFFYTKTSNITVQPDMVKNLQTSIVSFLSLGQQITGSYDIEGCLYDALNGETIQGATIKARTGWDNYNGPYVNQRLGSSNQTISDANGNFTLKMMVGQYTIEVEKEGYVIGFFNVYASKQNNTARQSCVLTPILDEDEYRIVLIWGATPSDLDSHLTYYLNGTKTWHVYYSEKKVIIDGKTIVVLDLDDTSSYGPETITIKKSLTSNEKFIYSVHNYSAGNTVGSLELSNSSDAIVRVYHGNDSIKTYYVPSGKSGTVWQVFSIDDTGVNDINKFFTKSATEIN